MKSTATTTSIERGILTSTYKKEIRNNIRNSKSESLSKIKSLMINNQHRIESQAGTVLKVSFFAIAFLLFSI